MLSEINNHFMTACDNNELQSVQNLISTYHIDPTSSNNHALISFIKHNNLDGVKYIVESIKKHNNLSPTSKIESFINDIQHKTIVNIADGYYSSEECDTLFYLIDYGILNVRRANTRMIASTAILALSYDNTKVARQILSAGTDDIKNMLKEGTFLMEAWIEGNLNTIKFVIDNDIDTGIYRKKFDSDENSPREENHVYDPEKLKRGNFNSIVYKIYMCDIFHYLYDSGMFETATKIVNNCVPLDSFDGKYVDASDFEHLSFDNEPITKLSRFALLGPNKITNKRYMCPIDKEIVSSLKSIAKSRASFHANLRNINNVTIVTHD